jgi:hypothetical protein
VFIARGEEGGGMSNIECCDGKIVTKLGESLAQALPAEN